MTPLTVICFITALQDIYSSAFNREIFVNRLIEQNVD